LNQHTADKTLLFHRDSTFYNIILPRYIRTIISCSQLYPNRFAYLGAAEGAGKVGLSDPSNTFGKVLQQSEYLGCTSGYCTSDSASSPLLNLAGTVQSIAFGLTFITYAVSNMKASPPAKKCGFSSAAEAPKNAAASGPCDDYKHRFVSYDIAATVTHILLPCMNATKLHQAGIRLDQPSSHHTDHKSCPCTRS
jgi:hypothetical protein